MKFSDDKSIVTDIDAKDIKQGMLTIPDAVKELAPFLCQQRSGITNLQLNEDVNIGEWAFIGCLGFTTLTIPRGVKIGRLAFAGCYNIKELIINEDVTIESQAFSNCSEIETLIIAEGVKLKKLAFLHCSSITKLIIAEGVSIEEDSFEECEHPDIVVEIEAYEDSDAYNKIFLSLPDYLQEKARACPPLPQKAAISNPNPEKKDVVGMQVERFFQPPADLNREDDAELSSTEADDLVRNINKKV